MGKKPKDIKSIFSEAIEKRTAEERATYLDKACGDDTELRSKIAELLKAHKEAGDFLEIPALEPDVTMESSAVIEGPGMTIGRYKLLELIGEGGMGLVYLAEQQEPVRRRVALKIIKPGMDSRSVIARFEAERQTLAVLDHPNIAYVLDAGITETGRPYFVMEYVKGMSINKHCDREKLSIEQRLKLFLQVCYAVQHAHQKGIIHRDIKPLNILVSVQDDRAVPKIIDFGIAKAVTQPLTEQTIYTKQGQLLGTPEYMSPEQADMANRDIDTRSDIYSLGVLLYELLTGAPPFDHEVLEKVGFAEVQRILQEDEPPRPSIRLTALGEEAKKIAERRHTQVVTLARRLHRELEWIPLKAMRKERSRRYRSASELADDIQNYLNGAPLIAGPETTMYRAKKFVRKHAGSVATVVLVAVALILGFVVSTTMYFRAEQARKNEAIARTRAEQAEKVAQERAEDYRRSLYFNRIALADSTHRQGDTRRVRQLLSSCPPDLRGWEWHHLWHISDQAIMTLRGHQSWVNSLALSPDGNRLVSGSSDKTIKVWDVKTGAEVMTLYGHEGYLCGVAFSPDGKHIASSSMDNTIKVWDANSGTELMTLLGHENYVYSVAFSPDGKHIISGSHDGTIRVWDSVSGTEQMILRGHRGSVSSAVYTPDGKRIISGGGWDNTVRVWDGISGDELMTLHGHESGVWSLALSSDGKRIASADDDAKIKVWDIASGEELLAISAHQVWVSDVAYSPDGTQIVSSGWDGTIKIWNGSTGAELRTLCGHEGMAGEVVLTPDGKRIISGGGDNTIKVWDLAAEGVYPKLRGHQGGVCGVAFSPDGKRILSDGHRTTRVWNFVTGEELLTLRHAPQGFFVKCADYSPDGGRIATSSCKAVKVWDATSGEEVMTIRGHEEEVYPVAFSLDNKRIVSGSRDKTVRVWDANTGVQQMVLRGHEKPVSSVSFSPHGEYIVSGSWDGTIKIWNAKSGAEVKTLYGHKDTIWSVAFSPDGKHIVSGGDNDSVKVWNVTTGAEVMSLPVGEFGVISVAFSPDSRRIIAAGRLDNTVWVWDANTGSEAVTLEVPGNSVAFSPDGKTIAVGGGEDITLLESAAPTGGYGPRRTAEAARELVDELYEEYGFYSEVIDKLKADKTLDEPVRKVALQIANSRLWEDTEKLRKEKQSSDSASPEEVAGKEKTERR